MRLKHTSFSTNKIIKLKAFNELLGDDVVHWASEMVEAGHESINLYMLAGISPPYNQFDLDALLTKVLDDLELTFDSKEKALSDYVYSLLTEAIEDISNYGKVLDELKDICIALNYDGFYMPFYLLYFARMDLSEMGIQHYWEGATRSNINTIIRGEFEKWINQYEQPQT